MWLIRLCPTEAAKMIGATETIQTIHSDSVEDFLQHPNGEWSWNAIDKMLRVGTLARVEIDFIPTTLGGTLARV